MNVRKRRPSWWQLWLLFPVLGILAFLDARTRLSVAGHRAAEVGIVLVIFALVAVWLRANQAAMLREVGEHMVWRGVDEPACLPLDPGAIAGHNGNGYKSAWILAGEPPEIDAVHGDREEENQ